MLRKRKRESSNDAACLSLASTKKDTTVVVHLDKSWPPYTVTVPNDFMSLERSIWPEADRFLFPNAMERIKDHTLPCMMLDGLELLF